MPFTSRYTEFEGGKVVIMATLLVSIGLIFITVGLALAKWTPSTSAPVAQFLISSGAMLVALAFVAWHRARKDHSRQTPNGQ